MEGGDVGLCLLERGDGFIISAQIVQNTALQIEGANVVTAVQAMQTELVDIEQNDRLKLASLTNIQSNIDIAVTIQQNQLDQLRLLVEDAATIGEHTERLRAIEQNTDRL